MLTLLPILTQVIAIVVWASFFFLLVNAPLAASSRRNMAHDGEMADPFPLGAGRGRPLAWHQDRAAWRAGDRSALSSSHSR